MGIVIKQSIRSSILAYLGVLIGYVNVLWLFPYFLGADQIGLFRLIQSSAFLMATFGQFGLGSALVKFFPKLKDQKGFLCFIVLGGFIGFITFAVFTFLFKTEITAYFAKESGLFIEYFGITLLISLLLIQFQLLEAYCRSLLRIVIPTFIRDIQLRLSVTVLVVLYALNIITFEGLIQWLSGAYLLMVITVVFYLHHLRAFHLSFNFKFISRPLLKQIITYAVYMMIGAGGTQIVLQIDSIMVSGALGLDATGIYTIAFFIGVVIEMPKRSITQISAPLISQAFEKNDMPAVEKLYKQTSINQMIIGSLLLIGIWANLESLYLFIPNGEIYIQGINVVLFIGLGKLSDMIFGTNGEIIVMSKHYKFNVVAVGVLAILTIALNLLLIPKYGIEGAAIASFLAMLTFNLSKFLFVWVKFKIQPFSLGSIKLLAIIGLVLWVNQWVPKIEQTLLDIVVRSTVITILLVGLTVGFKVSKEVNNLVFGFTNRLRKN